MRTQTDPCPHRPVGCAVRVANWQCGQKATATAFTLSSEQWSAETGQWTVSGDNIQWTVNILQCTLHSCDLQDPGTVMMTGDSDDDRRQGPALSCPS